MNCVNLTQNNIHIAPLYTIRNQYNYTKTIVFRITDIYKQPNKHFIT